MSLLNEYLTHKLAANQVICSEYMRYNRSVYLLNE